MGVHEWQAYIRPSINTDDKQASKKRSKESKETYANGGLILAANCGEKLLMVRVAFSLKEPAKL